MINKVTRGQIKWTPEMDAKLIQMKESKVDKYKIMDEFGLSLAAIDSRYYRLKREMAD